MAYVTAMTYSTEAQFLEAVEATKLAQQKAQASAALRSAPAAASFQNLLNERTTAYTAADSSSISQASDRYSSADLDAYFQEAADTYDLPVALLKAVAKQESNFQSDVVSSSGAVGIMQLMPGTASYLGVTDAYDPYQNIMGGAKLLSQLSSHYQGDLSLTLAAYNAGSGAVDKYGGIPPYTETQNFVAKIKASLGM